MSDPIEPTAMYAVMLAEPLTINGLTYGPSATPVYLRGAFLTAYLETATVASYVLTEAVG